MIYGSSYHIHIHSGIFWVKAQKIYQFSTYKNLTHLSLKFHDCGLSQGSKALHRLWIVFVFLYLSYIERQIAKRKSNTVREETQLIPMLGHPVCTRINDNLVWQHSDHKKWSHHRKCLVEGNKINRGKKRKKHKVWNTDCPSTFPMNFGSPWVFPEKFNLYDSEPFILYSPKYCMVNHLLPMKPSEPCL